MNITKILNKYFQDNKLTVESSVSIVREDGIVLYSNLQKKFRAESIGALAAGVWQAASALNSTLDISKSDVLDFRLGFDKSDEGVYLLAFKINFKNYIICSLYDGVINPAKLKMEIRNLKASIVKYLETAPIKEDSAKDYLFQNITDAEMDRLFEYGGA